MRIQPAWFVKTSKVHLVNPATGAAYCNRSYTAVPGPYWYNLRSGPIGDTYRRCPRCAAKAENSR